MRTPRLLELRMISKIRMGRETETHPQMSGQMVGAAETPPGETGTPTETRTTQTVTMMTGIWMMQDVADEEEEEEVVAEAATTRMTLGETPREIRVTADPVPLPFLIPLALGVRWLLTNSPLSLPSTGQIRPNWTSSSLSCNRLKPNGDGRMINWLLQ